MASIIVDLSDDIKKLQSLKAEIQEVKKELGSINVNVHLDIKRDMEAKLKSLTSQYDALVKKVSEAEGKVIASTQRINQAAEKIIKAQEQLAKATGVQSGTSANGGAAAAANQAETASVQAQAKAYEELEREINSILGTRESNIKRILEEQNAIRLINEEIKKLNKLQGSSPSASIQNRLAQLNDDLLTHKTSLSALRQAVNNNAKLDNAAATSMNALSQSLSRMRIAYRDLTEEERNSPFGRELLASIQQADAKIKSLDATIGNHQRNVGNYASGWNGLNMSIQQIGRELPSLAMGWNTFFLAISNNLPILADEIKRARVEYDNLKNAGQKATPVWKQVVASLVSWQTALTVGITLLTLYGDEIINWVSGLFGADSAQKKLNESLKDFNQTIIQGQAEAKLLFDAVKRTEEGTQGRVEAIRRINNEYGKYLPNLLSERSSLNELDAAYRTVTESIKEQTAAKMRSQAIEKIAGESIKKQADALTKMRDISKGVLGQERGSAAMDIVRSLTEDFLKAGDSVEEAWRGVSAKLQFDFGARTLPGSFYDTLKDYVESVYDSNKEIASIQERYNPFFNKKEADKAIVQNKEHWEEVKRQAQSVLDSIESATLEKLRAGNITGIPDAIVEKYKQAQSDIQKANKELNAYDFSQKKSKPQKQVMAPSITVPDEDVELITPEEIQKNIDHHREMMDKYLADYGDYQQKRLAIADMYALKIAQAETEGERRSLESERDSKLAGIETRQLKSEIDWSVVFGEFGGMFAEVIRPVFEQVKQYMRTDEFKNADHDSQQALVEAFQRMEESLGSVSKVSFKKLGSDIDAYRRSMERLRFAQDEYKEAYHELTEAQEAYKEALRTGTEAEQEAAMRAVNEAQTKADAASAAVNALQDSSDKAKTAISSTATTLKTSMDGVVSGLRQLASGSLRGAYDGLIELGKSAKNIAQLGKVGDAMGTISKGLENVPIVGWIASILDILKDGLTDFIQTIHDSATSAVTNIFDDVFSGDLFKQGFNNTLDSIEKTLNTFSFGLIDFNFNGSNAKEVQETIDRLTNRNESLQSSIEALNDTMKEARGSQSVQAAKQAEEYQEEVNRNYLDMAMTQAGYHGSHHSWNYYWEGFTREQIDKFSEQIGREWRGSLWDLSPEEMRKLKGNVDMWTRIQETGEGGYGERLTEKLDDYIEQAGKIAEINDSLAESLTGISFDSMYDSFIDNLMNMEYSAQDAADNIAEYFMRAMLSNKIGEMYYDKLEEWWKKFGKSMEDGVLSETERKSLMDEYMGYVNEAINLRDNLAAATGYDQIGSSASGQQATQGYQVTASQESVDVMNGRLTGIHMAVEEIRGQRALEASSIAELRGSISALTASSQGLRDIADETRSILAQSYLELQEINENTGAIVQPIKQMQKDIEQVRRNTERL